MKLIKRFKSYAFKTVGLRQPSTRTRNDKVWEKSKLEIMNYRPLVKKMDPGWRTRREGRQELHAGREGKVLAPGGHIQDAQGQVEVQDLRTRACGVSAQLGGARLCSHRPRRP